MTAQVHWTCSTHQISGDDRASLVDHVCGSNRCHIIESVTTTHSASNDASLKGLPHVLTDDERFDQWWAEDPRRAEQNHLKLSARIGWCGALQLVSEEREYARRFAAEHDGCVARERAERAEQRCVELSAEVGMWKMAEARERESYNSRVRALRAADEMVLSLSGEVETWKRAADRSEEIGDAIIQSREKLLSEERIVTRGLTVTIANRDARISELERLTQWHSCEPPLSNPTREEAIALLRSVAETIDPDGARCRCGNCLDRAYEAIRRVVPSKRTS